MVAGFKIKEIELRSEEGTRFSPKALTIIVGPNNAGKSRFLKEVRSALLGRLSDEDGGLILGRKIISTIELLLPESTDALFEWFDLDRKVVRDENGNYGVREYCNTGIHVNQYGQIVREECATKYQGQWKDVIESHYASPNDARALDALLNFIGPLLVGYSGTEDRLILSAGEPYYGVADSNTNFLSRVRSQDQILDDLSEISKRLFGKDVVLDDVTKGGMIQFKTGSDFSSYRTSARGTSDFEFLLEQGVSLKDEGDGFRSFVSVYLALRSGDKPVVLIDEPESFLHPPQAYELGKVIGSSAEQCSQMIIATHSTHLLNGIMSTCDWDNCDILRLQRDGDSLRANLLDREGLDRVKGDPLLRSTRLLEGVFTRVVVVVESESDELVYREILNKVGVADEAFFVNVHSKDRIAFAVEFYKNVGVPCCAVMDFDILNDKNKFKRVLKCFECDPSGRLSQIAQETRDAIECDAGKPEETKLRYKRDPLMYLDKIENEVEELLDRCLECGCLIVRTGELETVFGEKVAYRSSKRAWLSEALDYLNHLEPGELTSLAIVSDLIKMLQVAK